MQPGESGHAFVRLCPVAAERHPAFSHSVSLIWHCDTCSSLAFLFLFLLDTRLRTEEAAACPALLNRSDHHPN